MQLEMSLKSCFTCLGGAGRRRKVEGREAGREGGREYLWRLATVATACAFSHVGDDLRSFISLLAPSFVY